MTPEQIIARLRELKVPQEKIAEALGGLSRVQGTKLMNGNRSMKARDMAPLVQLIDRWEQRAKFDATPELPSVVAESGGYVHVDVLPTFAGMGGGGTGEGEIERALVPRYLVEDVFRGKPADFVIVRTRGDSMEPDFFQDDELLCDKRDRSPAQPGPFALRNGDEYLVKNMEKRPTGEILMFSSNPKYPRIDPIDEQTEIVGRPVWCGRRL